MRATIFAIASTLALTFAGAASADEATSALTPQPESMAQPISASANDDAKTVVCHHLVHEGLLMREQVCLTKRAWERVRLETQRSINDFQVHSYTVPAK
jgi:hypothetical protein